jgi:hypothetical protein
VRKRRGDSLPARRPQAWTRPEENDKRQETSGTHERRRELQVRRPPAVLSQTVQDLHDAPDRRRAVHAPAVQTLRVCSTRNAGARVRQTMIKRRKTERVCRPTWTIHISVWVGAIAAEMVRDCRASATTLQKSFLALQSAPPRLSEARARRRRAATDESERPSTPQQVRARACDGCNVGVQRPAVPQSIQSSRYGDQRQPASRRQLSAAERSAPFFRIDSRHLCWHRESDGWALYSSGQIRLDLDV